MESYQTKLAEFEQNNQTQEYEEDEYLTPTEKHLKQEVQELKNKIQTFHNPNADIIKQQAQNVVQTFANVKAEDGSSKHPHYTRLAPTMQALMSVMPEAELNSFETDGALLSHLYNKASRVDDEVFTMIEQERKVNEAKKRQQLIEKAKQTKKYASLNARVETKGLSAKDRNMQALSKLFNE